MERDKAMDVRLVTCSFCGKDCSQVSRMIQGTGVYVCCECVDLFASITNEEAESEGERDAIKSPDTNAPGSSIITIRTVLGKHSAETIFVKR